MRKILIRDKGARYEWRNATTNKSVMIITGHAILGILERILKGDLA